VNNIEVRSETELCGKDEIRGNEEMDKIEIGGI